MKNTIVAASVVLASMSCIAAQPEQIDPKSAYTLYRTSAITGGDKMRLHVATFDAMDGAEYNRDNCEIAKGLFQAQPSVRVTYWCERGYFSKT